ncbi:MAG: hypothetical protein WED06_03330 [Candidatus Paceibacterota bacterium]
MNKEELLTKLRDIAGKIAQQTIDIVHGELKFFDIKPRLAKLMELYIFAVESGDIDLLSQNTFGSVNSELSNLLDLVNRLPGEHHLLQDITNQYNSLSQYIPQFHALTYNQNSFKNQLDETKRIKKVAGDELKSLQEYSKSSKKTVTKALEDSANLLKNVSTGVLTKQIQEQLSSSWNLWIFITYGVIFVVSGYWLMLYAYEVRYALTSKTGFNFEALIVSWLAKLPVALLFVFSAILLRSRVKYIDELRYRKAVAGSLEAEITFIFDKASSLADKNEADKVRVLAIETLSEVIKKFSSSPGNSSKQEIRLDVSKLAGITAKDES